MKTILLILTIVAVTWCFTHCIWLRINQNFIQTHARHI